MASNINNTIPETGTIVKAKPLRDNFAAAKLEIEALQSLVLGGSASLAGSGAEPINYQEATTDVTVSFSTGDVQYIYVNPTGASIAITMPADPGSVSKAGILFIKNNTGKSHTWATFPAVRFVDQVDASTAPSPAADGYYTRYTAQWMDNNGGTGSWWVTVAGRDTA